MQLPPDLMISVSGIRGKIPGSFTPKIAAAITHAYCKLMSTGPIVVSRDSRGTGAAIKKGVVKAILDSSRDVLDADLIPLPTTQIAVIKSQAAGGIDITASHNPIEWNGLKLFSHEGIYIDQTIVDKIISSLTKDYLPARKRGVIKVINKKADQWHIDALMPYTIPGRQLTVAVDAVNGAGSYIIPKLLKKIGCQVIDIATNPNQLFPHIPEPIPQNLEWTQAQLKNKSFDLCVVVDPDADRLIFIDETGKILPEEFTLPLILQELIAQGEKGNIVMNYH